MVRPGTVEERRQLGPGGVDGPGRPKAARVGAPGAVAHRIQRRQDRLPHLGRLMKRGGRVI